MSMSTEPQVRDRVLDAAVELFAEYGYDGTSVAQVVTRAGVAKGGFYHHFPSKQALLYEVYGELINQQLESLDDILQRGLSPAAALRTMIRDLVLSTIGSAREATVFGREMFRLDDERADQSRRLRSRYHEAVQQLVRDGQRDGAFVPRIDPETVAYLVFSAVTALPLWYRPDGRKSADEIADELGDLMLAAVCSHPGQED